ncbi:c-type cytochrome [Alcaligenes sp. SDU_A2]|uniref:c-type cytochrome n=1 Tax=Alcaligenes sp. SDU_A2 TaxID=3136634 RepID=UPI002CCBC68D|nr:cytochrome c [Alcaligenes sp.]HRL28126.1 cytochrome c [Alcaligenes sp.]
MKWIFRMAALLCGLGMAQAAGADTTAALVGKTPQSDLSVQTSALLPLCASCHGVDGISSVGLYPNLAGQKADYIVKQLQAFKTRERNDPVMSSMAEPLSDDTIHELAKYFAGLK